MKYLILEPAEGVKDFPVVQCFFAPTLHKEVAARWAATHTPVSAGFVDFSPDGDVATFGASTSLQLAPRLQDAAILKSLNRATLAMARSSAPAL